MQRRPLVIGALLVILAAASCSAPPPQRQVDLDIASDGDFLAFKPTELTVATGVRVRLRFHHTGRYLTQDHDWVLLVPGSVAAFEAAIDRAGANYPALLHDNPQVISATPIAHPGQTVQTQFIAPGPGDYPFLCSTPGHGEDMHGVLHVTPSA
jgi:uncharacterized cupredoxin-like copper-binding protein